MPRSPEGWVFLAGIALAFAAICALAVTALWSGPYSQLLAAVAATNVIFGRIAAMSFGFAMGLRDATVILVNALIETLLILLLYPLLALSWQRLVEVRGLGRYLQTVRNTAERHQEKIRRYGIAGLFLFVWSPFWMTGPVVGCAIGILLGLPMWVVLSVVLTGTYVAILGWALAMRGLHEQAEQLGAVGPFLLLGTLLALFLLGYLLRARARRQRRN